MQFSWTRLFLWLAKKTISEAHQNRNKKNVFLHQTRLINNQSTFFNFKNYNQQTLLNRISCSNFNFNYRQSSMRLTSAPTANLQSINFKKYELSSNLSIRKNFIIDDNKFNLLYSSKRKPSTKLAKNLLRCFLEKAPLCSFYSFQPVTLISFNIFNSLSHLKFKFLLAQCLKIVPILQLNRVAANLIGAISTLLLFKECSGLATFIRNLFQKVHYSKHKPYFGFVGQLVNDVFRGEINKFHCLGLRIVFRGKLGVGGNSRKSALKYSVGVFSSSTKAIKINRNFSTIRTKTGAIGFSVTLAW